MKYLFLFIICISINSSVKSQFEDGEFRYFDYDYSEFADICETNDGNFIASLTFSKLPLVGTSFNERYFGSDLILFDKNYNEIKKKELFKGNNKIYNVLKISKLKTAPNLFVVSGYINDSFLIRDKIILKSYLVDNKLNFIDSLTVPVGLTTIYHDVGTSDEINGKISFYYNQFFSLQGKFTNVTIDLDIINRKFKSDYVVETANSPTAYSYFCPYEKKVKYLRQWTIEDDKSFSYFSYNAKAVSYAAKPLVFVVKDSSYILGFNLTNYDNYLGQVGGFCIAKIDKFLNIVNLYSMYKEPKSTANFGTTSADISNDRESFFISDLDVKTLPSGGFGFQFFNIHKVGLNLKQKWNITFGNNGQRYKSMSLRALRDGGVVICGGVPYSIAGVLYGQGFIVRLDKDGKLVKTVGIDKKELSYTKSYPNPTSGLFKIETNGLNLHHVKVFSLDGKEVLDYDGDGTSSTVELDLSSLSASIYLYNIYDKAGKILSSGKVVKE
jgi:hypothetical protein